MSTHKDTGILGPAAYIGVRTGRTTSGISNCTDIERPLKPQGRRPFEVFECDFDRTRNECRVDSVPQEDKP